MKTYPTLVRFSGMGYSHIVEQTAAQRGTTEQILDRQVVLRACPTTEDWPAFERRCLKVIRQFSEATS